jgi:cytochrome c556
MKKASATGVSALKKLVLASAAAAVLCGAAFAQRPAPNAAQTIQSRQANYKQMAGAQKGVADQLRAGSPDIAQIRRNAALLADRSVHVLAWFPRGTGPEAGVRTRAKAEIWSDAPGFRRAGANFVVAARALNRAAQAGDIAQIRAAFPTVGRTCGGCHDGYRTPAE